MKWKQVKGKSPAPRPGILLLAMVLLLVSTCQVPAVGQRMQYLLPETASAGPSRQAGEGDDLPPPPTEGRMPKELPMQSILWDAEQLAVKDALSGAELRQRLAEEGFTVDDAGRVLVEVVGPEGGKALDAGRLEPFGGVATNAWGRRTEAWMPVDQLTNLALSLPEGYFVERVGPPTYDQVGGEGPAATNSDSYRDGGADCTGITIGVIDGGFDNFTEARANGDAPAAGRTTLVNYSATSFEDPDDGTHGTGVVEALFDHCPDATWRIYKIDSLSDMGTAVTNGLNNGVDVFSHSISRYNTGWSDNSGDACAAANNASNNGAIFFTSSGNRARQHWQGNFADLTGGDDWHDWVSGDETIDITMPNGASGNFYLSWNTSGGTYDYDLYLYDSDVSTVLESSTNGGNSYESFYYRNNSGASKTVHLAVYRDSGGTTEFEVFAHMSSASYNFEHRHAAGSSTSPSNCTASNVISVGAVDWSDFSRPSGTSGIIESYSSQGPSNSGMTLPDLTGPTNTSGFTYGSFGGTSCATPNAAGTTAAFWSSAPALDGHGVRYLIKEKAQIYRDWGAAGNDNVYGRGGIQLFDYRWGTVWVDRRLSNTTGLATRPYYYVSHAQSAAPSGGRIVFLGQSYPEDIFLDKALLIESIGWNATMGD